MKGRHGVRGAFRRVVPRITRVDLLITRVDPSGTEGGHRLLEDATAVAASTGSACHSGVHAPSPVLTAMGLDTDRALAAIRLSLGRWSTGDDVAVAARALGSAATAR